MKKYLIPCISIIILIVGVFLTINLLDRSEEDEPILMSYVETTTTTTNKGNYFYVDIKGAVKKPGVYKVEEGTIVNELIILAGGLNKNAYTDNINLSKKLSSETVIYIYTKTEIKKSSTTTSIIPDTIYEIESTTTTSSSSTTKSNKININTASVNELTTLTGVGESKALAIIAYRTQSPFKTIEEIMNVSGIGESAFAKIKDNITV